MITNNVQIDSEKHYSIRETAKLLPWINSEPTLQKMIHNDIENNNNKIFKAIVLKRNKQRRYYLKGEFLIDIIKNVESGKLVQNGGLLTDKNNSRRE